MLDPATYNEQTKTVECIQTHISYLFLTEQFVYKIKKPVDFGFLNFTTLDRRRFYCNEEIRLNRRLSPDIYISVVEVRDTEKGIRIGFDGNIMEYAVKMKRLPASHMLDRLLAENRVTPLDIKRIASVIAEFHLNAEKSSEIDSYGSIDSITRNWEENFSQIAKFIGETIDNADLKIIKDWVTTFTKENNDLFIKRVNDGFIRDGDGDLHLENICLGEKVWIFDCIEFNNRFRCGDTASDLAFLLMDLDFHNHRPFSKLLLDEYVKISNDFEMLPLIDYYKIYRAMVRGKVASLQLRDPDISPEAKKTALLKAKRYFRLAKGYVFSQHLPLTLFITCGLMGSGKSFIGKAINFELGVELLQSDVLRKELAGLPLGSRRDDDFATGLYAPEAVQRVYSGLKQLADQKLASGESVIVDASFRNRLDRDEFKALATQHGAQCVIIYTFATEELCHERLDSRSLHTEEPSDGRWELFKRQKELFEQPAKDEGPIIFLNTSRPVDDNIDLIFERMGLYHAEQAHHKTS
jgi:aminoglycoside phosphotransferase family enzyme/predicted kinase